MPAPPANTSATGGYLVPSSTNSNLDDLLFSEFLQPIIVGITGLPGAMVRPRWQAEEPNIPDFGTDWAAIGTTARRADTNPAIAHVSTGGVGTSGVGSDNVYRCEELDILVSFYGPNCEANSDLLIMGFGVSQNREQMLLQGYGFVSCGDPIITADILNERWTRRVDVPFQVRRAVVYNYPVLDILSAAGTVVNDEGEPSLPFAASATQK